jgi:hypothetical protein
MVLSCLILPSSAPEQRQQTQQTDKQRSGTRQQQPRRQVPRPASNHTGTAGREEQLSTEPNKARSSLQPLLASRKPPFTACASQMLPKYFVSIRFSPRSPSHLLFLRFVGPPSQPRPHPDFLSREHELAHLLVTSDNQVSRFLCPFFCTSASSSTSTGKIFTSARGADVGLNAVLRSERERPPIQSYRLFDEHRPFFRAV